MDVKQVFAGWVAAAGTKALVVNSEPERGDLLLYVRSMHRYLSLIREAAVQ